MYSAGLAIELPNVLPILTLPNTVLFPQSIIRLYIFEPRYKQMLADAVSGQRIFVVANKDENVEAPCKIATAGIIRLSKLNIDGTSHVILQGISRVRIEKIIQESPYQRALISTLFPKNMFSLLDFAQKQKVFIQLLKEREALGVEFPTEAKAIFENLKNIEAISDLAAHAFCPIPKLRQQILETQSPEERMLLLVEFMKKEINVLRLKNSLQGNLSDNDISSN